MSKLEDLVPPLELCKLIPKGEFEDSALVWLFVDGEYFVAPRGAAQDNISLSAPTLQEIMEELFFISHGFDLACFWDGGWHIKTNEGEKFSGISPGCGALKLWLTLKGIDYE